MPRKRMLDKDSAPKVKRTKVSHHSHCTEPGLVLTLGQGDLGQLGLGPDVLARKRPALVELPENIIQAEAGGVHTVCLSGTGKDENGVIGLLAPLKGGEGLASASGSSVPVELQLNVPIVKIASGSHHLALVSMTGILYTCGCGDNGQLGRVHPVFTVRGGRKGLERLLLPQPVIFKQKGCRTKGHVRDVFCGSYSTIAITEEGHVIGFGLSNYYQLGSQNIDTYYSPKILTAFKNSTKSWIEFSAGQHHTVCLDSEGTVYSLGRADYGMLGLGEGVAEKNTPIAIPGLPKSTSVACGERVGYAVTEDGCAFAWGMGSNLQLATGEEDDAWSPVQMSGQQLQNRTVLSVKGGGQHTVLLVKDRQS
ncbi:regulator of chromosome condensation isoform X2 [Hemicordylus capensis]|uniref:regulator of chromosome condensation isoform X2 n=1 Tax=Hemicordylus capensis TaxID=884348 RepID=UPI00230338D6|nr:regulator of chromosome condensation isoform X2 [Hemicordylus capensis]